MSLGVIVLVMFAGGLIAGLIGYSRVGGVGTFIGLFIFGALLPLIGIIVACLVKPKPTQLAGWYADPWTQAAWRWWDGYQWTWQTSGQRG